MACGEDRADMTRHRTFLIFLLSLVLALAPAISVAMAKPCPASTEMTDGGMADCPCSKSMLRCGGMLQCQSATGCAGQCLFPSGVMPTMAQQDGPASDVLNDGVSQKLSSLSRKPPAPPPRV